MEKNKQLQTFDQLDPYRTENKTQILNKNIRSRAETKKKIEYFVVVAGCRAKEEMDINRKQKKKEKTLLFLGSYCCCFYAPCRVR